MDAFFAAIEERDKEWLRELPVVVGADPEKGQGRRVVSTANYKAREYGIRSAMPISKAWHLSEEAHKKGLPRAEFLGTDFERYSEVSRHILEIIRRYSPRIEEASVDEAYFDLSFAKKYEKAEEIARQIKKEISDKENLTASVGIGPNKLIAKIASDIKKPDGLTVIHEEDAERFLEPLPIRKIPGIGPKTEIIFNRKGIKTVGDLKKFSLSEMENFLGKWGIDLYLRIRGKDDSPIVEEYEVKSIGEQETFSEDTRDPNFVFERLQLLCKNVHKRFSHEGFQNFLTIVITIRFSDFETKTRSHTLKIPSNASKIILIEALKLFMPFLDHRENPKSKKIRLIGVRIEKLS